MAEFGSGTLMNVGVYVGRFNPVHKGHQRTIDKMLLNHTPNHSLIMVGSANSPLCLRNIFSYKERRDFIKEIYPEIKIVPLSDQPSDEDWFSSLIDISNAVFPFFHRINLYCGDVNDVSNFPYDDKITLQIVDRYTEQIYSATEVRYHIIMANKSAIESLLDEAILGPIYELGRKRLEELIKGEC